MREGALAPGKITAWENSGQAVKIEVVMLSAAKTSRNAEILRSRCSLRMTGQGNSAEVSTSYLEAQMGKTALIVADMLNDFLDPGGSLYVGAQAREIIPFVAQKIAACSGRRRRGDFCLRCPRP